MRKGQKCWGIRGIEILEGTYEGQESRMDHSPWGRFKFSSAGKEYRLNKIFFSKPEVLSYYQTKISEMEKELNRFLENFDRYILVHKRTGHEMQFDSLDALIAEMEKKPTEVFMIIHQRGKVKTPMSIDWGDHSSITQKVVNHGRSKNRKVAKSKNGKNR